MVMLTILKTIPCLSLAAVDATLLISCGMNPSSGQAIIWRTIQDSNLKPIA